MGVIEWGFIVFLGMVLFCCVGLTVAILSAHYNPKKKFDLEEWGKRNDVLLPPDPFKARHLRKDPAQEAELKELYRRQEIKRARGRKKGE